MELADVVLLELKDAGPTGLHFMDLCENVFEHDAVQPTSEGAIRKALEQLRDERRAYGGDGDVWFIDDE